MRTMTARIQTLQPASWMETITALLSSNPAVRHKAFKALFHCQAAAVSKPTFAVKLKWTSNLNAIAVWLWSERRKTTGAKFPHTQNERALTLRFVHKGLYGANCRALDDITAIFERHNALCRIMKGRTHFKKLISFPFVLQSDDTNPPTMAACFAGRRTESKSARFCEAQRAATAEKGPRGKRSSFIERTPLRRALPSDNTGYEKLRWKTSKRQRDPVFVPVTHNCEDKVGDLCFALERRLLKSRERSRHSAVYLPDI